MLNKKTKTYGERLCHPCNQNFKNDRWKAPIIIRIIVGRSVSKTINTGFKVDPDPWDLVNRKVKPGEPNASIYNMMLKRDVSKLKADLASKSLMGVLITKARAKKIAEGKDPRGDFYKFCLDWIKEKYSNSETLRTYNSEISKLKLYRKELSFGDIDFNF